MSPSGQPEQRVLAEWDVASSGEPRRNEYSKQG
jgi:hypothetical protein